MWQGQMDLDQWNVKLSKTGAGWRSLTIYQDRPFQERSIKVFDSSNAAFLTERRYCALCFERKYKSSSWNFEKFKSEDLCWESLQQLTEGYRLVTAKRPPYLKVISPGLQLREVWRCLHQQGCFPAKVQMGSERPARPLWRGEGRRREVRKDADGLFSGAIRPPYAQFMGLTAREKAASMQDQVRVVRRLSGTDEERGYSSEEKKSNPNWLQTNEKIRKPGKKPAWILSAAAGGK